MRQVDPWPHVVHAGPFTRRLRAGLALDPGVLGLVIDTPAGRILHSADFKIDPTPVVGEPFDPEAFRAIGDAGVKVLVCNSTNVFSPHPGRSEATLIEPIGALMQAAEGLVVATTFASNVARLKTLAEAGRAAGREVVVLGRAMNTMLKTAHAAEVLDGFPADPRRHRRRHRAARAALLVLATGSQGERRAATAQLAAGTLHGPRAAAPATPSSSRRRPSPATRSRSRAS